MFSKLLKNSRVPEPDLPDKETYLCYRNAGKDLNTKIMEAMVDDAALRYGSRALKMGRGRQLILDSESDLDVLMEYIFFEYRVDEKNVVQRYYEEIGAENEMEEALLAAELTTKTALFKVDAVSKKTYSLHLTEVLNEDHALTLIDINFSQMIVPGPLMFIRPVTLGNFSMTSGIAFVFPTEEEAFLREKVRRLSRRQETPQQAARRFETFFRLSKSRGIDVAYVQT